MRDIGIDLITNDNKILFLNRKLGFGNVIKDADQWNVESAKPDCWLKD